MVWSAGILPAQDWSPAIKIGGLSAAATPGLPAPSP
jgi:hypothetical protein